MMSAACSMSSFFNDWRRSDNSIELMHAARVHFLMIGEEVITVLSATQYHQLDLAKTVKSHRPDVKWKKELKKY